LMPEDGQRDLVHPCEILLLEASTLTAV